MELSDAVILLSALAQPTRFRCMAMLAEKGEATAGDLASSLSVPANTMSSHLTVLAHAGLVSSSKAGRHVVYRAHAERVELLIERLSTLAASELKAE
ncbi:MULTISPECIES: ArsR/SmtB family transcription factor [Sphingomonas]|uniref:ArsR/SmtB family transcription factor n=1 Tax=Sphingomonas TaxID=13687 RepID=UPI000833869D|nr:metalloregulator ArsR/SmtB family transcription factor [Sphingomonas pituitosa]